MYRIISCYRELCRVLSSIRDRLVSESSQKLTNPVSSRCASSSPLFPPHISCQPLLMLPSYCISISMHVFITAMSSRSLIIRPGMSYFQFATSFRRYCARHSETVFQSRQSSLPLGGFDVRDNDGLPYAPHKLDHSLAAARCFTARAQYR